MARRLLRNSAGLVMRSGHPDMPEFKFSHDDAFAVRAYLRAIQQ